MNPTAASTPRLSIVIITRDEASDIADCLASVAFAHEWIVVDSASTDATREIARSMGANVSVTDDWPGFGAQKNRALAQATGEWIFSIDADERVSPQLAAEIQAIVARNSPEPTGYDIPRLSSFNGQWMRHGDWYPDRVLRLARRSQARFTDDVVHERLTVQGRVAHLQGHLLHHTMRSFDDALVKMNRYSSARAASARAGSGGLFAACTHAAWAFCRSYVFKLGFLDGRLGFVLAVYIAEGTFWRYVKRAFA